MDCIMELGSLNPSEIPYLSLDPLCLLIQFGMYFGALSPQDTIGSDIDLLLLNSVMDLEPLSIHSKLHSLRYPPMSPMSQMNVTIRKNQIGLFGGHKTPWITKLL